MNERRLVEDLVLVSILLKVVKQGVTDLSDPISIATMRSLQQAATDILDTLSPSARPKVLRRVQGLGTRCINKHVPIGTPIVWLGLAGYLILKHLTDEDYLSIGGASPLGGAVDSILISLQPASEIPEYMSKARIMAAAIYEDLVKEGLFRNVCSLENSLEEAKF